MAHRWSPEDQKLIDGTKKVTGKVVGGTKNIGSKAFYKYVVPDKPRTFMGRQLAKNKPKENPKKQGLLSKATARLKLKKAV